MSLELIELSSQIIHRNIKSHNSRDSNALRDACGCDDDSFQVLDVCSEASEEDGIRLAMNLLCKQIVRPQPFKASICYQILLSQG